MYSLVCPVAGSKPHTFTHTHTHTPHTHTHTTHTHTHMHTHALTHICTHTLTHSRTHTRTQEYDNDAETLISAMTMTPDDDELDKALKLSHVDMYNKKVTEREKRKL